jgi:hypothetical protein
MRFPAYLATVARVLPQVFQEPLQHMPVVAAVR